jgi:hypothetical protein
LVVVFVRQFDVVDQVYLNLQRGLRRHLFVLHWWQAHIEAVLGFVIEGHRSKHAV